MCEDVKVNVYKVVEDCVIIVIVGIDVCDGICEVFCCKLCNGELDDIVIELEV